MYYALCIKCNQSKEEVFHKRFYLALTLPLSSVKYCERRKKKKNPIWLTITPNCCCYTCGKLRCLALGTWEEEKEGGIVGKRDGLTWKIQLSGHLNPGKDWYCFECMGDHLGSGSGLTYKILIKKCREQVDGEVWQRVTEVECQVCSFWQYLFNFALNPFFNLLQGNKWLLFC